MIPETSAARRAWWFGNNWESTDDARYGTGHRPTYARVCAGWIAACGCVDSSCRLADDGWQYASPVEALDAACTNLAAQEHGPKAGQEQ